MIKNLFLSVLFCVISMCVMAQSQTVTHVVQRGETIESIAKYYNVSVEDITKANPNADGIVYTGMKLLIPTHQANERVLSGSKKESTNRKNDVLTQDFNESKEQTHEEVKKGFQFARIKASYLFPTDIENSGQGHYSNSYFFSFALEGEYIFNQNVFAGFGLGYMGAGSQSSDKYSKEGYSVQVQTSYNNLIIPLNLGYRMTITKDVHFDIYTGPLATITINGYQKTRESTSSDWRKTKFKDIENAKSFAATWDAGVRINLWSYELGVEYWYSLTKVNKGGSNSFIAVCFSVHM